MDTISWSAEEVNKLEAIKNKVGRLGLEEKLDHLTVILKESKFREVINLHNNGLGFLLGIGNDTPWWQK